MERLTLGTERNNDPGSGMQSSKFCFSESPISVWIQCYQTYGYQFLKDLEKAKWWSILMSDPFCTGLFYPGAVSYKQCTMYAGKTLQNYHACALIDPTKMDNLMTPVTPELLTGAQNTALWRWRSTKAWSSSPINQSVGILKHPIGLRCWKGIYPTGSMGLVYLPTLNTWFVCR